MMLKIMCSDQFSTAVFVFPLDFVKFFSYQGKEVVIHFRDGDKISYPNVFSVEILSENSGSTRVISSGSR